MDEHTREKHRTEIQVAVSRALEAGWTGEEITSEVENEIEVFEES